MIEFQGFSYRYPNMKEWALDSIDLHIPEGQFCGVVGPNGAGKSSLCYAISGFIPHFFHGETKGKVSLSEENVASSSLGKLSGQVGMVFQNPFNQISGTRFTVREEIAFGLENLGLDRAKMETRVEWALDIVGLTEQAERSPYSLSGGQQQRVAIASILAMQPKVLVLDEPTSQLDPRSSKEVFSALEALVNEGGTTVVIVEHKLEWLASFAERVLFIGSGKLLADGDPQEVLGTEANINKNIGQTRFTQVSSRARQLGLVRKKEKLPVTLEQADSFLS